MKKAARFIWLVVALLMLSTVVLVACQKPQSVKISTSSAMVAVGKTITLPYELTGKGEPTWTTSDAAVATVTDGKVTGVKEGTATITAALGTAKATCKITVIPANSTYTDDLKNYTNNGYMNNTPSNWNEMDYQNNDDTAIINNTTSSFFGYDYALKDDTKGRVKADGTLNIENIDFEHHVVTYEAATKLEDVTDEYADAWGLTAAQKKAGGYVWRITLRDDLAWDDGTPIKAQDFVYSMKEQLNYLFQPFRANTYWSGNGMKIHNAKNYYYQGRTVDIPIDGLTIDKLTAGTDGKYTYNGQSIYLALRTANAVIDGDSVGDYIDAFGGEIFDMEAWALLEAAMDNKASGRAAVTDATLEALATILTPFGKSDSALKFVYMTQSFAAMDFDEVGIFAEDSNELALIVVLDNPESWIREDGKLSYTISNASLPLVKQSLYESLKKAPTQGSEKWTTTYNTSVETSASWGPYKLTFFQVDKQFTLERNTFWYGYAMESKKDQYLTDKFVVEVIQEDNAIQMAFWKGEIDDITFDQLGNAAQYQNSDYAVFSPDTSATAYGIQLYSNLSVLKNSGKNNGILAIRDFRWALSLAFDRNTFNQDQLVGMQLGLGLLGPGYYYDPENSLSYRGSDAAKAALLRTYGFTLNSAGKWTDGITVFEDIDDATDAMTGYNLTMAKEKLALAITELTNNAEKYGYDSNKDIVLRIGKFNPKAERRAELIQKCVDDLVKGSVLENKIKIEVLEINAQKSADEFRDGKFELYCVAGIGGAVFYPFSSIDSYLGFGENSYHSYMDTNFQLTMNMPAGNYECAGQEVTLTTKDWFYSLNGKMSEGATYDWSEGKCPSEVRLEILAMLEEYALSQHHTIQVANSYDAVLMSAKSHYITRTYNTFMALGGAQYMRYNYTDEQWTVFIAQHNGDLSEFYKTSSAN